MCDGAGVVDPKREEGVCQGDGFLGRGSLLVGRVREVEAGDEGVLRVGEGDGGDGRGGDVRAVGFEECDVVCAVITIISTALHPSGDRRTGRIRRGGEVAD